MQGFVMHILQVLVGGFQSTRPEMYISGAWTDRHNVSLDHLLLLGCHGHQARSARTEGRDMSRVSGPEQEGQCCPHPKMTQSTLLQRQRSVYFVTRKTNQDQD